MLNTNSADDEALNVLTPSEKKILKLIARDKTNKEIAGELYLSPGTARNYVSNVLSKLHVSNRAEAAAYAIKHRLTDYIN